MALMAVKPYFQTITITSYMLKEGILLGVSNRFWLFNQTLNQAQFDIEFNVEIEIFIQYNPI